MEPITATIITLYVADKLVAQFIKEEGYGRIKSFFFPTKKYRNRLQNILLDVIKEYKNLQSTTRSEAENKIAFYESEITFEALSNLVLFKTKQHDLVIEVFKSDNRVLVPTQSEIEEFFKILFSKVSSDKILKNLFIEENYKAEIFSISQELENFAESLKEVRKDTTEIISQLGAMNAGIAAIKEKFNVDIQISDFLNFIDSGVPPLIDFYSAREEVVLSIIELLQTKVWIELNGGVGIGKTQLAILIANNHPSDVCWIGLREAKNKNYFSYIFFNLSAKLGINPRSNFGEWLEIVISKLNKGTLIILDDLPRIEGGTQSDKLFFDFIRKCETAGIIILSTSNYQLSNRIKEEFLNGKVDGFAIPYLSEVEVEEVLISIGASVENASIFKKIVRSISVGHPIVVTSICRYLKANSWEISAEQLTGLFKGDYLAEFSDEINNKLIETVVDKESRELLYRLKLINGYFIKEEVEIVSQIQPQIRLVTEKLNALVGLWIQKTSTNAFQLSPLIKNLKEDNIGSSDKKKIHSELGRYILKKKALNPIDALNSITYFINAEKYNDAGFVLTLVLNESRKNQQLYFEWGFSVFWTNNTLPLEMDIFLKLYIRILQIMVFQDDKKDIEFLKNDLEILVSEASSKGVDITSPALLLSTIYALSNPPKAKSYFLQGLKGLNELKEIKEFQKIYSETGISEELIWALCFGIKNESDLMEWFNTFKELSKEVKEKCLESEGYDMASVIMGHNIILEESKKPFADWDSVLVTMEKMESRASELGLGLLAANAIRYQINLLSEKKSEIDAAKEVGDKGLLKFIQNKKAKFLINDALGRQLYYKGRSLDSTKYVLDAVVLIVPVLYTEKVDTFLVASWILGENDNTAAHYYCEKSFQLASTSDSVSDVAKAKISSEFAVSLWINNDLKRAIQILVDAYEKIINTYKSSHEYKALVIRIGHTLNYFYQLLSTGTPPEKTFDDKDYLPPIRGFFLRTNDIELSDSTFFEARLYINAHLCLKCCEELNDLDSSKKWAYYNIRIDESLRVNPYKPVLLEVICYLIIDNKYKQSFSFLKEIIEKANQLLENDFSVKELVTEENFKRYLSDEKRPPKKFEQLDDLLIIICIVPSICNILKHYGSNREDGLISAKIFLNDLRDIKLLFKEPKAYEKICQLIELLIGGEINVEEQLVKVNEYNGEYRDSVLMISYLIFSKFAKADKSFELHKAMSKTIEGYFIKGTSPSYRFIIFPFFESFWLNKIQHNSFEFKAPELLLKQIDIQVSSEGLTSKLKTLFNVIGVGLK